MPHSKKGSLSQTFLKNTEANAKVDDLKQKTMQALESLAAVYAAFEKAGEDLRKGKQRLNKSARWSRPPQQNQERARGQLYDCRERLRHGRRGRAGNAVKGPRQSGMLLASFARIRADEPHEQVNDQKERCTRLSAVYATT